MSTNLVDNNPPSIYNEHTKKLMTFSQQIASLFELLKIEEKNG